MARRIAESFIDELRSRTDIVDVISGYMHLSQKGNRYWGLCPFHGEKTSSFSVDRQRQFFYCFGCHKGGNVYHFVMEQEHLEFYEAVEMLADKVGMKIPRDERDSEPQIDKELRARATEAATEAARFFRDMLNSQEGKKAMDYCLGRGITMQAIRRFGMGYSPDGWDVLYKHLSQKGFSDEEMLTAGLVVKKNEKCFDMFRGRVMFPIFSRTGQVIAFGGRIMGDGQPKYLNSAETPIFNKRRNLYALNFLKGQKNIKELLLVEGYVDVVSLFSHGVTTAVATLGTAITQDQARIMKNYSRNVTVCYDGDSAGQTATERAILILRAADIEPKVLQLPGGQDPDDFVRANGAIAFMELPRKSATQYLLDREKSKFDLSQAEGRTGYAMAACKILKEIEQPVVLEGFVRSLIIDTGFSREVLQEQIGRSIATAEKTDIISQPAVNNSYKKAQALPDYVRAQRALVAILASNASLPKGLIKAEDFSDEVCIRLSQVLLAANESVADRSAYMMERIGADAELRNEAARILSEQDQISPKDIAQMIKQYLRVIEISRVEGEIKRLSAGLQDASKEERTEVLGQVGALMARLKDLKDRRN